MDYLNILAFGRNVRRIFNFFNLSFTLDIMVQINFRVSLLTQCKLSRNPMPSIHHPKQDEASWPGLDSTIKI